MSLWVLSEYCRDIGVEFHHFAGYGMDERDDLCMEAEAAERVRLCAIAFVAGDRVADRS
jgi:hypothetical protein